MRAIRVRSLAVAAVAAAVPTAQAGLFPALNVQWKLNGNMVFDGFPNAGPNGQGAYRYVGSHSSGGVIMTFNLVGDPDPLVSGNFVVHNMSSATVEVELLVTLPIAPSVAAPSSMTGSVAGGMTADPDGGLLSTLPGIPFWQAMIDGTAVGGATALLTNLALSADPSQSVDLGNGGFVQVAGPEALDSIGILVTFSLTAGDQTSFTSVFYVAPAPGGLAVMGMGALLIRRRRRAC